MTTKTITITPTWQSLVDPLMELYKSGETYEVRRIAREELHRMARAADRAVEMSNVTYPITPSEDSVKAVG